VTLAKEASFKRKDERQETKDGEGATGDIAGTPMLRSMVSGCLILGPFERFELCRHSRNTG